MLIQKSRVRVRYSGLIADCPHCPFNYAYFGRLATANVTDSRFGQLNPEQDNQPRTAVLVLKVLF